MGKYELHKFKDQSFPVTFHFDVLGKNHRLKEHWHEHPEIIYCVEGEAEMIINSQGVPIKKGGVTIVNPYALHYPMATGENGARYFCLIPSSSVFEQLGIYIGENELCEFIQSDEINGIMENIIKEMREKKPYYQNVVKAGITALICVLKRNSTDSYKDDAKDIMVRKGVEYLEEHFRESILIDDVVSAVGYSRYYFCREFKKITGYTINEYIKYLRCNEAKRLLKNSDMSVSSVATECGFDDISYFTKVFKKQMGVLPSKVRKK